MAPKGPKTRSIADHKKQRRNRPKAQLVARIARLVRQGGVGLRRLAVRRPPGSAEV